MLSERSLVKDVSVLVTMSDHFARDVTGTLFHYAEGVYVTGADFFIRRRIKHIVLEAHLAERWSRGLANEVIEFILLDAPELADRPSRALVNVQNGLLDIWTGELLPHSPDFLSTIRIPIRYDPYVRCPAIEAFIGQVFPRDCGELAWEILGDLLTPDRSIQKAICLIGEGGNGKGVFSELAVNFIGRENVAHLSLHRLEQDRFAVARLYGKLANICSDLPSERLADSAVFKALAGGDRITGELKYRDSFEFEPYVRLLFSANHLPASRDASRAYFDRWLIVPFENRFRGTGAEIPRQVLDTRLSSSVELSGALNCVLPALRRVRQRGNFSETDTTRTHVERFQQATDPCHLWLQSQTVASSSALISQERLYSAYAMACIASGQPVITRQMFGRKVKRWRPELEEAQRVLDGKKQWVYLGIAIGDSDAGTHAIHAI